MFMLDCPSAWLLVSIVKNLDAPSNTVELAWHSSCVIDCHVMARGSIPGGNGVKTELHVLRNLGTVNGDAVSK